MPKRRISRLSTHTDPDLEKLLLVGDSFAAPYKDHQDCWYQCLGAKVDNRAQAGVGQYKILQQLKQHYRAHDRILIVLTSELRIHTESNPFYSRRDRHAHADFIFSDVESRTGDPDADHLIWWFTNVFDLRHARYVNNLILKDMHEFLNTITAQWRVITFFRSYSGQYDFGGRLEDFSMFWENNSGEVNHLSSTGHASVAANINLWLDTNLNNLYNSNKIGHPRP